LALFIFGKGVKPLEKQFYTFSFWNGYSTDVFFRVCENISDGV